MPSLTLEDLIKSKDEHVYAVTQKLVHTRAHKLKDASTKSPNSA